MAIVFRPVQNIREAFMIQSCQVIDLRNGSRINLTLCVKSRLSFFGFLVFASLGLVGVQRKESVWDITSCKSEKRATRSSRSYE